MPTFLAGGCRCGACRYTLELGALPATYACHCLHCQTMTGGAFALQAPVPDARLTLRGELSAWGLIASNGHRTTQRFCAACMTRLFSRNDGRPGLTLLRAGTLDDSHRLSPALHMWVSRKQPWIALPAGVEAHPEGVPADRMAALVAPNFA